MVIIFIVLLCIMNCMLYAQDETVFDTTSIDELVYATANRHKIPEKKHVLKRALRKHKSGEESSPKRAIIIGASAGMGRALAKQLAADGYIVGMAARRLHLLQELQEEIPTQTYIAYMDAADTDASIATLNAMIEEMGGLDLLVITITGFYDCDFASSDWQQSLPVLAVDVVGFFALARTGLNFFENQGYGHLVGFSSIDGLHGSAGAPAYSGSKAFCSRYLEAERNKYIQRNIPIFVTDMIPGWIDSKHDFDYAAMPQAYWVETLDDAMRDIYEAIQNKTPVAYITKRWEKVAQLLATIPNDLYNALSARPGGSL
jgi:short-subunit dehydrogenase